jgi:hypothetical protein
MYKIKSQRASGSAFPCIFSDDFRPTIRKSASALHWNIVLCVYSKHNNGKARSRENHGASPSLWKEYYLKTRQTIQVGSGKPLEAAISNFIILEMKTSEKRGYSVTFSIR